MTPTRAPEGLSGEPAGSMEVGGEVRRIVILTVGLHPCAAYLARELRDSGAEIYLVNQSRLAVEPGSRAYFRRLLSRRGWWVTLDNLLLLMVKGVGRRVASMVRRVRASSNPSEFHDVTTPALRPHPEIADESWLQYVEATNVNKNPDRERLAGIRPDLILLAGAPILTRRTIALANVACINPHCGITPEYAGSSPIEWPVSLGRYTDIGYTVHLVIPKVDSGPVLWQERVSWDPRLSLGHVSYLLTQHMYDKVVEIAREMIQGKSFVAAPQGKGRVRPPAGLCVRLIAEARRIRYARKQARSKGDVHEKTHS